MKEKFSAVAKCFLAVILANFLCFFMFTSFSVIAVGVGTKNIGYTAYKQVDGEYEELYTHYFTDGEDTKKAEYEKQGIGVVTTVFRSPVSKTASLVVRTLSSISAAIILVTIIYSQFWKKGDKDNNLATFGHIKRDKLKGLKIGLLSVIPFGALYLLLWVDKYINFYSGFSSLFKIINYYLFPWIDLCFGGAKSASEISVLGMFGLLVTLLPIPLVSSLAYYFGNSEISIGQKLIYVNRKEKK